jgi:hypothetical protein
MGGRVYDPIIGRFLSRDPLLAVGHGQGANGYAYTWNNPLRYTDPSGFKPADSAQEVYCDDSGNCTVSASRLTYSIHSWAGLQGYSVGNINLAQPAGPRTSTTSADAGVPEEEIPAEDEPQGQEDPTEPICNAPGLGGGGLPLSQRAELARLQAVGGVVGGALLGRLPGAMLGYAAAIGYNGYNLRAGGAWVQGGSRQGNLAYGAAAQGLGIPLQAAQRFAGLYEQYGPSSGGTYRRANGTFYSDPPYGDDPGAQQAIADGYACGQ